MPVATTVPEKLPTGITKFKNGFRTRMRYGLGNNNEISKCFTNTKNTDEQNYNLALNWLSMVKIQKQSGTPRETLDAEFENEQSIKKLPELISRDRNGYLATYYNENGDRKQKSFQGGKYGGFNDENLQNAMAFRDSMTCNHPKNKKKEQNGKGDDIDETKITLDNIKNYTIDNLTKILKKREIYCPSKWIKKDYIEQVTTVLKLGKDKVKEEKNVKKEIIIEDEESDDEESEDELGNETDLDNDIEESEKEEIVIEEVNENTKEEQKNNIKFDKLINIFSDKTLSVQNQQIICRSSDGYINLTQMAKIHGKRFHNWNQNKETQAFLQAVASSAGIPAEELLVFEKGSNENRATWAHPLIAINFAQWCNVDFGVQVSKWIFELISTGKVELGNEKEMKDIENIWKEKCKQLEIQAEKNLIEITYKITENISLKKSLANYEKSHHYPTFNINGPVYYIISNSECSDNCPSSNRFKHGVAGTKKICTFDTRLQQHRTTMPLLHVDFVVMYKNPITIERTMEDLFEKQLNPNNHEFFQGNNEEFKQIFMDKVQTFLSMFDKDQYEILSADKIKEYNDDIDITNKSFH